MGGERGEPGAQTHGLSWGGSMKTWGGSMKADLPSTCTPPHGRMQSLPSFLYVCCGQRARHWRKTNTHQCLSWRNERFAEGDGLNRDYSARRGHPRWAVRRQQLRVCDGLSRNLPVRKLGSQGFMPTCQELISPERKYGQAK